MTTPEPVPQPASFRPSEYHALGVAALTRVADMVMGIFAGLRDDQLVLLELLGGVDPGLVSQLTAAPVGTWNRVLAAARAVAPELGERRVWTWAPSCQRPGEVFYTRDRDGARAAWAALDMSGTDRRAEQVEAWRRILRRSGPLTEITYDEFHLDVKREAGDGRDND